MSDERFTELKAGLAAWAEQNGIRPVDFANRMGYSPAYGWSLLRGKAAASENMLGRLALKYGAEAVGMVLSLAARSQDATSQLGRVSGNSSNKNKSRNGLGIAPGNDLIRQDGAVTR